MKGWMPPDYYPPAEQLKHLMLRQLQQGQIGTATGDGSLTQAQLPTTAQQHIPTAPCIFFRVS